MVHKTLIAVAAIVLGSAALAADESPNAVIESSVTLLAEKLDGRQQELTENRTELYAVIDEILMPAGAATEDGHRRTGADANRRRSVSQGRLAGACGFAVHAVGGHDQAGLSGF